MEHTHTHTDTQTHTHTDTQTHRHTHTETHRHTDTHTHIQFYIYRFIYIAYRQLRVGSNQPILDLAYYLIYP